MSGGAEREVDAWGEPIRQKDERGGTERGAPLAEAGVSSPSVAVDLEALRGPSLWVWTVLLVLLAWMSLGSGGMSGIFGNETTMWMMMMERGGRFMGGGMNDGMMAGVIMLALPIVTCAGALSILGAWIFLYMYFMTYVLPLVVPAVAGVEKGKPPARELDPRAAGWQFERHSKRGAGYLRRAYQLMIVGAAAKLGPSLIMAVLPWVGRF